MNDERPSADDTSAEGDEARDRRGDQSSSRSRAASLTDVGITDDDMERIRSFLRKQRHSRSADDLRPSEER